MTRAELSTYENQIVRDIKQIYAQYMIDNHKEQIDREEEFISTLGVSKLLRDSFFLLMDGDSRSASFKINAMHLMANQTNDTDQF